MKNALAIIGILTCFHLQGQFDTTRLHLNNVNAFIANSGTFFYDFENQQKGYEVPKNSGIHALKSMQLWFAAKDADGETYFSQGGIPHQGSDIFNGPISDPSVYNSTEYSSWNQTLYTICQSTIDQYKLSYECAMDPACNEEFLLSSDEIDQIYNWPAHGDVSLGQAFYLAPYTPYNEADYDGIYDPSQGATPKIKGCCASYLIQNDEADTHSLTASAPIGIELHIQLYQYQRDDFLNDATFVEVTAINRSAVDYPEFIHSIAIEAALGNEANDLFGSDSTASTLFFYNANNQDETSEQSMGYSENPPAIGIVALQAGTSASAPFTGDETVEEKWNLMKGLQPDGSPWIHPDGYATTYVFSGNPNDPSAWNALSANDTPGNAMGLLSHSFGEFKSGDTLQQTYAILYTREGNHLENAENLSVLATTLQQLYDTPEGITCDTGTAQLYEEDFLPFTIVPNPNQGTCLLSNPTQSPLDISIFNLQGQLIHHETNNKDPEIALHLGNQKKGVYLLQILSGQQVTTKKIIVQ